MDAATITEFIQSVGFPIAAYIALFWYMIKQRENHKIEINQLTEALSNNTLALQHLADSMGVRTDGKH